MKTGTEHPLTQWLNRETGAWAGLPDALKGSAIEEQADLLLDQAVRFAGQIHHGDLPRWVSALNELIGINISPGVLDLHCAAPVLGGPPKLAGEQAALESGLMALHPWRKGPLRLAGTMIDTEWRSDMKWDRVANHIDVKGHTVLDVGCGNGYYGWRLLGDGARCVIGIDPTALFLMQWLAQKRCSGNANHYVLPMKDTDLSASLTGFDSVFSMGVLYHRRDPADHLRRLWDALRPGGQLVLETLVLDQPGIDVLRPGERYARMRNVWQVPTPDLLCQQVTAAGFIEARVVDRTATSVSEQRSTPWMHFESLANCLDPENPAMTVEGHPAPVRALVVAHKPS